jgi:type IX secretion system PorP/SprF family membrane protein
MNRLHLITLVVFCVQLGYSQQLPLFTQYRSNQGLINPAAFNSDYFSDEHNFSFGGSYRNQWTGFEGNPRTQNIWGEYFQQKRGGFNLLTGGYLLNDQTGPTGFTGVYGRIGGIFSSDPRFSGISVALNLGAVQYRIDGNDLRFRDEGDVVGMENRAQWYPDAGLGVFAYTALNGGFFDDDYLYGGISIPQVMGLDLTFENPDGTFYTKRVQHIYAQAGLYHYFSDESFLETSTWVKYAINSPVNVDLNVRYQMQSNFWGGAGLSSSGTIHLEAGFILGANAGFDNNLKIGYGFDHYLTTFGPFTGPSHELNLTFSIEK